MGKQGIDVSFNDPGTDPAELRRAILEIRAELGRRDYEYLRVINLIASNISISAGAQDSPVGTIGRDPQSDNVWGFIAERGYGFFARYTGPNYARFFVDSGNDGGQSTPSAIMDMPIPNKFKFSDNEGFTMFRLYGGHGQEVGFSGVDDNYFDGFGGGNNGGAFDLFVPMRHLTYSYGGGTSGGPEAAPGYAWPGFMYYRQNYGAGLVSDLRLFTGTSWQSVRTFHPESVEGSPFVADTVRVLEHVTVTIS